MKRVVKTRMVPTISVTTLIMFAFLSASAALLELAAPVTDPLTELLA